MHLRKILNVNKYYSFRGGIDNLDRLLQKTRIKESGDLYNFTASPTVNKSFECTYKSSLGVLVAFPGHISSKGITVYGSFVQKSKHEIKIELKTKLRLEFYVFAVFALAFYIAMPFSAKDIPFWVYFFPVIPIVWFQFLYREQEKDIIEQIEYLLNLEELKKQEYGNK